MLRAPVIHRHGYLHNFTSKAFHRKGGGRRKERADVLRFPSGPRRSPSRSASPVSTLCPRVATGGMSWARLGGAPPGLPRAAAGKCMNHPSAGRRPDSAVNTCYFTLSLSKALPRREPGNAVTVPRACVAPSPELRVLALGRWPPRPSAVWFTLPREASDVAPLGDPTDPARTVLAALSATVACTDHTHRWPLITICPLSFDSAPGINCPCSNPIKAGFGEG